MDFYIPSTKRELVSWLSNRYAGKVTNFRSMDKRQLLAIYISAMKKGAEK